MPTKISIIGCGKVGMTTAYTLVLHGLANELVLLGRCKDNLVGEELDLEHSMSFLNQTKVKASENYRDIENSSIVIITAGSAQKPGETRLNLAEKNKNIISGIIPRVLKHAPNAIILIVSNPVDVLTYAAYKIAGLPKGRVFGTGTTLDTARFRFHLSEFLHVNPKSIHAYVLGEHGDSSFPVFSSATVGGQPLTQFPGFSHEKANQAFIKAKTAAKKIIESKGSTYYGISVVVSHIVKAILRDTKSVLPVSIPLHGTHGHHGVSLSLPCIVGKNGVEKTLEIKLSWEERARLERSVGVLKEYL